MTERGTQERHQYQITQNATNATNPRLKSQYNITIHDNCKMATSFPLSTTLNTKRNDLQKSDCNSDVMAYLLIVCLWLKEYLFCKTGARDDLFDS